MSKIEWKIGNKYVISNGEVMSMYGDQRISRGADSIDPILLGNESYSLDFNLEGVHLTSSRTKLLVIEEYREPIKIEKWAVVSVAHHDMFNIFALKEHAEEWVKKASIPYVIIKMTGTEER